jgi:hypothetical protein
MILCLIQVAAKAKKKNKMTPTVMKMIQVCVSGTNRSGTVHWNLSGQTENTRFEFIGLAVHIKPVL